MSVREIRYKTRKPLSAEEKKKAREKIERLQEEESRMVTGIFKNRDGEGSVSFSYRIYKGEPTRVYEFEDGKTYTIPLGVARHINNGTKVKLRDYIVGPDGKKDLATYVKGTRERYQFVSTDFI